MLAAARADRVEAEAREVSILSHAVEWARLHQVDDIDRAAQWVPAGAGLVGVAIAAYATLLLWGASRSRGGGATR